MMRALRLALLATGFALAAALWWMQAGAIDPVQHDRYSGALRKLQALDAQLDDDLLRVRAGALRQYDPLVRALIEMRRLAEEHAVSPRFIDARVRLQLDDEMKQFTAALVDKERRIDEFKTEYSVLRNSLYYFPTLAAELGDRDALGRPLLAEIAGLERDVLAYALLGEPTVAARVDERLARVQALGTKPARDAALLRDVTLLTQHAGVVRERKQRTDALVAAILSLPTAERADQVYVTYITDHREALVRSSLRRAIVYVLVMVAIALAAALIISQLRRAARALAAEQEKSERLLLNVLPAPIADRLKRGDERHRRPLRRGDGAVRRHRRLHAAVGAHRRPSELVELLNERVLARSTRSPSGTAREDQDHRRRVHGGRRHARSRAPTTPRRSREMALDMLAQSHACAASAAGRPRHAHRHPHRPGRRRRHRHARSSSTICGATR